MKLLKNIAMGIWMYWDLRHIRGYQKKIHKYRREENFEEERKYICLGESTWGKNLAEKAGVTVHVEGEENIYDGACVIIANHQSYCDIAALTCAMPEKQFGFIAKNTLRKLPLFGQWIQDVRSVFIDRDDVRESLKAIEEGISFLKLGFSLGIFPEGVRSRGPEMAPFKKGSLRLAVKPKMPILPITISGTYKCFEDKGFICPGEVYIHIHPLIETKDLSKEELSALPEKVEGQIREKLLELQSLYGI